MSAGEKFNDDARYYSRTYDVVEYNENAESDELEYVVSAAFVNAHDADAYVAQRADEPHAHMIVGIRPPDDAVRRTLAWLGARAR